MKSSNRSVTTGTFLLSASLMCFPLQAKAATSADRVTAQEGKTMVFENGNPVPLTEEINLTPAIKVSTNATFTVNQGKPRALPDGAILASNGMLSTPDGKVSPVIDHLVKKGNQVLLFKDGVASPLTRDYVLPTGTRVTPSGVMHTRKGQLQRMIEGQMVELSGSVIQAQDTVTLRGGKVFVQKEGSQFEIAPNRTFMMNDGSNVYGNGTVVKKDGTVIRLSEGQILTLPGVIFQPR